MVQTKNNCLYICEIKFTKKIIGSAIIEGVQQKIDTLQIKGMSYRPVLIHVGEVAASVKESDYFVKIIDFSELVR